MTCTCSFLFYFFLFSFLNTINIALLTTVESRFEFLFFFDPDHFESCSELPLSFDSDIVELRFNLLFFFDTDHFESRFE